MKKFFGTFFACLVLVYVFLFFGGWVLFDFSHHYFLAGAAVAFLLSVLISFWLSQEERMDALEKRIQALEHPEDAKDSENKENDQ